MIAPNTQNPVSTNIILSANIIFNMQIPRKHNLNINNVIICRNNGNYFTTERKPTHAFLLTIPRSRSTPGKMHSGDD